MYAMFDDSDYLTDKDINNDPLVGPGRDSSGPLDNTSDDMHGERKLGLNNPNG